MESVEISLVTDYSKFLTSICSGLRIFDVYLENTVGVTKTTFFKDLSLIGVVASA